MAARRRFSDSGRKYARGSAPARTPTASDNSPRSIRNAALTLLSRRDYSIAELRNKLVDREYTLSDIDTVISDLTSSGLLDDRRVAAAHVRTATAIKGRGRLRVARELAARGVPRDIAAEALAVLDKDDEARAIRRILVRKKWPAKPALADRRRMFQHLLRRGFPSDAIRKALGGDEPEDM